MRPDLNECLLVCCLSFSLLGAALHKDLFRGKVTASSDSHPAEVAAQTKKPKRPPAKSDRWEFEP